MSGYKHACSSTNTCWRSASISYSCAAVRSAKPLHCHSIMFISLSGRRLETFEHVDHVDAEFGHDRPAFEHEDGRQAEEADALADAQEVAAGEAEVRTRIAAETVDAQRHDERLRREPRHLQAGGLQRKEPLRGAC